jgi:hypothetical protein
MLQRPELRKNAASLLRWDESFTAGAQRFTGEIFLAPPKRCL